MYKFIAENQIYELKTETAFFKRSILEPAFAKRKKELVITKYLYLFCFISGLLIIATLGNMILSSFNNYQGVLSTINQWLDHTQEIPSTQWIMRKPQN